MIYPMIYDRLALFFTRKPSSWLSRAILWATQEPGEDESQASHVGCIVNRGTLQEVGCVEALHRVRRHNLWDRYHRSGNEMTIYRPRGLPLTAEFRMLRGILSHVGDRYGYLKIGLHLLRKLSGDPDWLKLSFVDDWPICSYLVATEFEKEGLTFGVKGRMATPDDMLDFCQAHPEKYELVRPWALV